MGRTTRARCGRAYVKAGGNPIYAPTVSTHATALGGAAQPTNADALSKQNQDQGSTSCCPARSQCDHGGRRKTRRRYERTQYPVEQWDPYTESVSRDHA